MSWGWRTQLSLDSLQTWMRKKGQRIQRAVIHVQHKYTVQSKMLKVKNTDIERPTNCNAATSNLAKSVSVHNLSAISSLEKPTVIKPRGQILIAATRHIIFCITGSISEKLVILTVREMCAKLRSIWLVTLPIPRVFPWRRQFNWWRQQRRKSRKAYNIWPLEYMTRSLPPRTIGICLQLRTWTTTMSRGCSWRIWSMTRMNWPFGKTSVDRRGCQQ